MPLVTNRQVSEALGTPQLSQNPAVVLQSATGNGRSMSGVVCWWIYGEDVVFQGKN